MRKIELLAPAGSVEVCMLQYRQEQMQYTWGEANFLLEPMLIILMMSN